MFPYFVSLVNSKELSVIAETNHESLQRLHCFDGGDPLEVVILLRGGLVSLLGRPPDLGDYPVACDPKLAPVQMEGADLVRQLAHVEKQGNLLGLDGIVLPKEKNPKMRQL